MGRAKRAAKGGVVYHVLNRANARMTIFEKDEDYEAFERIVEEAAAAGVRTVWMQPGAESAAAIEKAKALGLGVIAEGPCVLVVQGYRE